MELYTIRLTLPLPPTPLASTAVAVVEAYLLIPRNVSDSGEGDTARDRRPFGFHGSARRPSVE